MLSEKGLNRESNYLDDRVAFWHAHWLMIKEKPLYGHGVQLDETYRQPYYAEIGLSDFSKKYAAHNMYIQILTNGGILLLFIFFIWLFLLYRYILLKLESERFMCIQALLGFLVASLTQNAFQDSSVRVTLSILLSFLYLLHASHNNLLNTPNNRV